MAKRYDFDLRLLDLKLPDMSGHEVLRQLRLARIDTPTLILSGDDNTDSKIRGLGSDAGMCGDYNSVIGMNAENSLNRFLKKNSVKHFPAIGEATLSGVIVECNINTGLATNIESYIFGAQLKNTH